MMREGVETEMTMGGGVGVRIEKGVVGNKRTLELYDEIWGLLNRAGEDEVVVMDEWVGEERKEFRRRYINLRQSMNLKTKGSVDRVAFNTGGQVVRMKLVRGGELR